MAISKRNKGTTKIDWGFDTSGLEFVSIGTLMPNITYQMRGCFISPDHGYGETPVIIMSDKLVNIPARYVDTIRDILSDPDDVQQIKSGHAGFYYTTFISQKWKKTGYDIEFVDM